MRITKNGKAVAPTNSTPRIPNVTSRDSELAKPTTASASIYAEERANITLNPPSTSHNVASYHPPLDSGVVPHIHGGIALRDYNVSGLQLYFNSASIDDLPNRQTQLYWSDDLASVYVKTGSVCVIVNGERVELQDKELCLIKPQTAFYVEGIEDASAVFYLGFTNESLFSYSSEFKERYVDPIFHTPEPRFAIYRNSALLHAPLVTLLKQIEQLVIMRYPGFELVLIGKIHEYLYFVWSELGRTFFLPPDKKDPDADAFRAMHRFIRQNYAKNISVQDVCAAAGVSRNNCFAIFQKITKTSPARFLNEYRLECARELLITTDESIAKIAQACGFSHQSHFGRNFNIHFGVTPLRFRHEARRAEIAASRSVNLPDQSRFDFTDEGLHLSKTLMERAETIQRTTAHAPSNPMKSADRTAAKTSEAAVTKTLSKTVRRPTNPDQE